MASVASIHGAERKNGGRTMGIVTEMLTTLGANLPLVAVGCAEVLAAAARCGRDE